MYVEHCSTCMHVPPVCISIKVPQPTRYNRQGTTNRTLYYMYACATMYIYESTTTEVQLTEHCIIRMHVPLCISIKVPQQRYN